MKICKKCKIEKEASEFHKKHDSKDGFKTNCKVCCNEHNKINYLNNLTKEKKRNKRRYNENINNIKFIRKNHYIINKEKILSKNKKERKINPNRTKIINKKWRNKNLEKDNEIKKKWFCKNPEYSKNYIKKWRENNKYIVIWRNMLNSVLNRLGKKKESTTIELLGYSALEFKNHITVLFTDGMSWDNYGEWHIDHIKTVVSFDKETPMNIVNSLSNLRPLWATTREINGVIYEGNLNRVKY